MKKFESHLFHTLNIDKKDYDALDFLSCIFFYKFKTGVNVNRKTPTGKTPLHLASATGYGEIVNTLLYNGKKMFHRFMNLSIIHYVSLLIEK